MTRGSFVDRRSCHLLSFFVDPKPQSGSKLRTEVVHLESLGSQRRRHYTRFVQMEYRPDRPFDQFGVEVVGAERVREGFRDLFRDHRSTNTKNKKKYLSHRGSCVCRNLGRFEPRRGGVGCLNEILNSKISIPYTVCCPRVIYNEGRSSRVFSLPSCLVVRPHEQCTGKLQGR